MHIRDFIEKTKAESDALKVLEGQASQKIELFKAASAETQKAAEAGNLQSYSEWKVIAASAEKDALALRDKISAAPRTAEAEIVSVWNNHIKDHNRDFEKKRAAYEKARAALCEQFMELVEMQREALELQDAAMDLMDEIRTDRPGRTRMVYELRHGPASSYGFDALAMLPQDDHECKYAGFTTIPEAAFFIGAGDLPKSRLSGLTSVVKKRITCSQEYLANGPDLSAWGCTGLF